MSFVQASRELFEVDVLLGYNSDSACFEINYVFLLIVLLSFVTKGNGSWTAYGRQADIRRDVVFLRRIANHLRSKLTTRYVSLDRTIEGYRSATSVRMIRSLSFVKGNREMFVEE